MCGVVKVVCAARKPEGLSGRWMWNPVSEPDARAGGTHEAGFGQRSAKIFGVADVFESGVVGGEKKNERWRDDRGLRRCRFPPKRNTRRMTSASQRRSSSSEK